MENQVSNSYSDDFNRTYLQISVNIKDFGNITNCNNETVSFLGFTKNELINYNINVI